MLARHVVTVARSLTSAAAAIALAACGGDSAGQPCDAEHPCPPDETCDLAAGVCVAVEVVECADASACPDDAPYCVGLPADMAALGECSASCDVDAACAAVTPDAPFCNDMVCGACQLDTNAGCSADSATPICATEEAAPAACRGCVADAECSSGVCEDAGSCARALDVIYASTGGDAGAACEQAAPCTLTAAAAALAAGPRRIIKLLGEPGDVYALTSTLPLDGDGLLVGSGAEIVLQGVADAPALLVSGVLAIRDVTVRGARGNLYAAGIATTGGSEVALRRVTLTDNDGGGVRADGPLVIDASSLHDNGLAAILHTDTALVMSSELYANGSIGAIVANGPLTLRDSTVRDNENDGVYLGVDGPHEIERSVLADNGRHGLQASSTFTLNASTISGNASTGIRAVADGIAPQITNNIIARNGASDGNLAAGGAALVIAAGGRFAFNTVAFNVASPDGYGGATCDYPGFIGFVEMHGNLVFANSHPQGDDAQVDGPCSWTTSLLVGGAASADLAFVDEGGGDFHLTAASTLAIDQANALAGVGTDLDGDPRPTGDAADYGADEFVP